MRIILASKSPRRKEILQKLGIDFEVIVPDVDENVGDLAPDKTVEAISEKKAKAVLKKLADKKDTLIIAADTVVNIGGKILGKPKDEKEAKKMLKTLSGNTHTVFTGYTLCLGNKTYTGHEATRVKFKKLTDAEIENYVNTGEPLDKAGAYGIQGKAIVFVEGINGDFFNAVGFPVFRICEKIKSEFGIDLVFTGGEKNV
ncbi:MAG: septum formation protein Maf [Clostridia bacterium]|nr:septum formation protein Maf [Clostridia bacterium]